MRIPIQPVVAVAVFVTVLAALAAAPAAFAFPPQCEFSCTCNSRCSQICAIGNWVVNCGFDQTCVDFCFASAPATAETVELQTADRTSDEAGSCDSPEPARPALDLALSLAEGSPTAAASFPR